MILLLLPFYKSNKSWDAVDDIDVIMVKALGIMPNNISLFKYLLQQLTLHLEFQQTSSSFCHHWKLHQRHSHPSSS